MFIGRFYKTISKVYNNIGVSYYKLHEYEKSIEFHFKSLDFSKKTLGEEHKFTLQILGNIGTVYHSLNKHQESLFYLNKSLEGFMAFYGEDSYDAQNIRDLIVQISNETK